MGNWGSDGLIWSIPNFSARGAVVEKSTVRTKREPQLRQHSSFKQIQSISPTVPGSQIGEESKRQSSKASEGQKWRDGETAKDEDSETAKYEDVKGARRAENTGRKRHKAIIADSAESAPFLSFSPLEGN